MAVLLLSTLSHVPSTADAAKVVTTLMDSAPSGSYLAIYHLASDLDPLMAAAFKQWNAAAAVPIVLRSSDDVGALVAGLDLVSPGLVPLNDWRPDAVRSARRGDAGPGPRPRRTEALTFCDQPRLTPFGHPRTIDV